MNEGRAKFEADCNFYGLDPNTTNWATLVWAKCRACFEETCNSNGLDPKKTTWEDLGRAQCRASFEDFCKSFRMNPELVARNRKPRWISIRETELG